jgi:imidazolonepropionase-like amidohydrolase
MKKLYILLTLLVLCIKGFSQETFPINGVKDSRKDIYYAFTNANIYIDYQTLVKNGTLLIKDGKVEQAGINVKIPTGAVVYDLKGKFIYPSFIDLYSDYGMPEVKPAQWSPNPQYERKSTGAVNWNQAIKPDVKASALFTPNEQKAEELRKAGFGIVLSHQHDGIARGTGALIALGKGLENELIIEGEAAAFYSFNKGSSTQNYPSSLMGSIALLRQTYLDADWYKTNKGKIKEYNLSLDEWNRIQKFPQIFEANDKLNILRADKIGDEFKIQYIIKGGGDEYQRIKEIKETGAPLIIPIAYPDLYDVEDPFDAQMVDLSQMKHWEMAPSNLYFLSKNQITFALTAHGLKDKNAFLSNLKKAYERGISSTEILKALTYTPAQLIKQENKIGALKPGMLANFFISNDSLFTEKFTIHENWIQGKQFIIQPAVSFDIRGDYDVNIGTGNVYVLKVSGEENALKASVQLLNDTTFKKDATISRKENLISITFPIKEINDTGLVRLSGTISYTSGIWDGKGQLSNGKWINWSAIKKSNFKTEIKKDSLSLKDTVIGPILYPFVAYGNTEIPKQEKVLIKNATVWTLEEQGTIITDVLINNGKIAAIGTINSKDTIGAKVIDATGKHLTPGIIDEHSHIAISRGVNEGSQSISSEVRIGDVINSEDINIYRQLAGGVTAAQLLHGSANAIGGQSALVKLRWGYAPEQMKIQNADGFIKFALGENVKQSNWGERETIRYPQTRMGVEQVFYDAFTRAKEYKREMEEYAKLPAKIKATKPSPRRDLELDALVEILDKKRFISCHSYVQSEINMLIHVGDSMGFVVNTFTHILEGYKVADKMKKHGAGGSTFSDWWAYKFEVNDAIPFNASLMNAMGIVTAINSDDAEMGRRLNQEAAKSLKYGGMSEVDALKMVTLNPAKLLHLDKFTGSIKVGKDADLVLWSDHPLSIYAKVEKTFVDGICFFDREKDAQQKILVEQERSRIIQKMIQAKKGGERTIKPESRKRRHFHCDTLGEEGSEEENMH